MSTEATRGELLIDLADAIRELTEPRQHTEYLEVSVTQERPAKNGRARRVKRTQQRKAHVVTLPSLLDSLAEAAVPGAADGFGSAASFESRPSAELEPLSVLREIADDIGFWARTFQIEREGLRANLSALVGAPHDLPQLGLITSQARRWVRRARLATGFDPVPITLNEPCPYCLKRHSLRITGDLQSARCSRCGVEWSPDTIGLLADMLTANETRETMTQAPCWMPNCTKAGEHEVHGDGRGHTWLDHCKLSYPGGTLSA